MAKENTTEKSTKGKGKNKILYFVLFLLFVAILLVILVATGVLDCSKIKSEPKLGKSVAKKSSNLKRMKKNTYLLPREFFQKDVFPNAIMNDRARTVIQKKYLPLMVGVPSTGKPFRLDLPRPISEELVHEIIEAATWKNPQDMFFIKTSEPPTLIGYERTISGEMTSYCDDNADSCTPVDIYFYQGIYNHDEPNV